MICVEKDPIIQKINFAINHATGKSWSKRDKLAALNELLLFVEHLNEIDPEGVDPDNFYSPSSKMVAELEPIIPYGSIGKINYHCEYCGERVQREDRYCRKCGHKFIREGKT